MARARLDFRPAGGGGGGGVTDHGSLTGLADDDHPQYGDHSQLSNLDADDHPQYRDLYDTNYVRYVTVDGNDANDGLTWGTAFATHRAAVADLNVLNATGAQTSHCGHIFFGPGRFVEQITDALGPISLNRNIINHLMPGGSAGSSSGTYDVIGTTIVVDNTSSGSLPLYSTVEAVDDGAGYVQFTDWSHGNFWYNGLIRNESDGTWDGPAFYFVRAGFEAGMYNVRFVDFDNWAVWVERAAVNFNADLLYANRCGRMYEAAEITHSTDTIKIVDAAGTPIALTYTAVSGITGTSGQSYLTCANHGRTTGDAIKFSSMNGTPRGDGLDTTSIFYVRRRTQNTFEVYTSRVNARNGSSKITLSANVTSTSMVPYRIADGDLVWPVAMAQASTRAASGSSGSTLTVDNNQRFPAAPSATASTSVTLTNATDLFTKAGHGLANGDRVRVSSIVTTTGLDTEAVYYVVAVAGDDFQVSLTAGGTAEVLDTGNGTCTVTPCRAITIDGDLRSYTALSGADEMTGLYPTSSWEDGAVVTIDGGNLPLGLEMARPYYARDIGTGAAGTLKLALESGGTAVPIDTYDGVCAIVTRPGFLNVGILNNTNSMVTIDRVQADDNKGCMLYFDVSEINGSDACSIYMRDVKGENKAGNNVGHPGAHVDIVWINQSTPTASRPNHSIYVELDRVSGQCDGEFKGSTTSTGDQGHTDPMNTHYIVRLSPAPNAASSTSTHAKVKVKRAVSSGRASNGSASYRNGVIYNGAALTLTSVTLTNAGDLFTKSNHGLVDGDRVVPSSIVTTTGLNASTVYYVVGVSGNNFQVSQTEGGTAVVLGTGNGTCTLSVGKSLGDSEGFEELWVWGDGGNLYAHWYGNRCIAWGEGSPEGVLAAGVGSMYNDILGGTSSTHYAKESGAGTTGWIAYGGAGTPPDILSAYLVGDSAAVNNSTTVQASNVFEISGVAANTEYMLDGFLIWDGATAADVKFGIWCPTSSTIYWTGGGIATGSAGTGNVVQSYSSTINSADQVSGVGTAGSETVARPTGTILTAGSAGTVGVRFAQNLADVSDLKLRAGSWIRLTPII